MIPNIEVLTDIVSLSLIRESKKREEEGKPKMTYKERSCLIEICCRKAARQDTGLGSIKNKTFKLKKEVGERLNKRKEYVKNRRWVEEFHRFSFEQMEREAHGGLVPYFDDYKPLKRS